MSMQYCIKHCRIGYIIALKLITFLFNVHATVLACSGSTHHGNKGKGMSHANLKANASFVVRSEFAQALATLITK